MENSKETKVCKHCQTEIPKKAKVCPNCRKKQNGIGIWIVVFGLLLLIIGVASGGTNNEPDNNETEEVDNVFSVGESAETETLKISFLSQIWLPDVIQLTPEEVNSS